MTERELETAIAGGAGSVKALARQTGCGSQCGRCIPTVRQMLQLECSTVPASDLRPRPDVVLPTMASA